MKVLSTVITRRHNYDLLAGYMSLLRRLSKLRRFIKDNTSAEKSEGLPIKQQIFDKIQQYSFT